MRTALTIGSFDGVHIGHAALVERARQRVGDDGRVVVLCFDPHPLSRLRPEACPARLSTFEQRRRWLRKLDASQVVRLEPADELLGQSPEAFIRGMVELHEPSVIVEGRDFRFGRARAGDIGTLGELGDRLGFETDVVEGVEAVLTDHTIVEASSSIVRWLIVHGRVGDAARVLGREYEMAGTVVPGDRRGREIGYPTANLDSACAAPAEGVYAGTAEIGKGNEPGTRREVPAAISVGTKPQFQGTGAGVVVEAHLLAEDEPAAIPAVDEYGWPVRLRFLAFLRDQVAFPSVDALLGQMARDCARTRRVVRDHRASSQRGGQATTSEVRA